MTKYIWITVLMIVFVLLLAFKQAKNEPDVFVPDQNQEQQADQQSQEQDITSQENEGEEHNQVEQ